MAEVLRLLQGLEWSHAGGHEVVVASARALAVDGVGVCLGAEPGKWEAVWCSDAVSRGFEDLQLTLGEGPGADCMATGSVVRVPDLARVRADHWPGLTIELSDQAAQAVFCFPLRIGAISLGVLTLLRRTSGPLTGPQTDDATILAGSLAKQYLERGSPAALPPQETLDASPFVQHAVVHQATGMASVQLGVPLAEALLRLRAHAYSSGHTLMGTASDIVARRLRLAPDPRQIPPPAADKD